MSAVHARLDDFEDVPVLDNFYQTSAFFPMPVVLVATRADDGAANLGPYSLCFPHVISGRHSMILIARGNSNTATNLRRDGLASLNFIPDDSRLLANCVLLGFPGESTTAKMKDSVFTLVPSHRGPGFPPLVGEAVQSFECTWDRSTPHEINGLEHHYVLTIDRILMHPPWRQALHDGSHFPHLPVAYGYRDGASFWFSKAKTPWAVGVPKGKGLNAEGVKFDGDRIDPAVAFSLEAAAQLIDVPRIFLHTVLQGCVAAAKAAHVAMITPEFLATVRAKRSHHPATLLEKIGRFFGPRS